MHQEIAHYRIERQLGAGGMGVVYLANDTLLDRKVAIKALPDHLGADPDRLARFELEAKNLAQLNHPNIAGIHGIEEKDDQLFLVLEYVPGETLAAHLERGPMQLDDALGIATQIAAGIAAAHDAGVIHRDLKPANIMLTPDGKAKILDFGLARTDAAVVAVPSEQDSATTVSSPPPHSPTIAGAILGTAGYMSPEQARGKPVDRRTDVWSFGVLLYEMVTGLAPFQGETVSDSIGALLHKDIDYDQLPRETPPAVQHVLVRCLARDKDRRWQSLADVGIELEEAKLRSEGDVTASPSRRNSGVPMFALIAAAAISLVFAGLLVSERVRRIERSQPPRLVAEIMPPAGFSIAGASHPIALSADGSELAMILQDTNGQQSLWVRSITTARAHRVTDVNRASAPFWSPDGRQIGFNTATALWMVDADGGVPQRIEAPGLSGNAAPGAAWFDDGSILYSSALGPVMRTGVKSQTSEIENYPFPDIPDGWCIWPCALPDGRHYLFTNMSLTHGGLYLAERGKDEVIKLASARSNGTYVDPGYIVYFEGTALWAQKLDEQRGRLVGDPTRVTDEITYRGYPDAATFTTSRNGLLAYHAGDAQLSDTELVWIDRDTGEVEKTDIRGSLWAPRLSHDDRFVAVDISTSDTAGDIWIVNLDRGTRTRLTSDQQNETSPVWSADDSLIYFRRSRGLWVMQSDGRGEPKMLLESSTAKFILDMTPDDSALVFVEQDDDVTLYRELELASRSEKTWLEVNQTIPRNLEAVIAPNGRWITLVPKFAGVGELYLTDFPEARRRILVSSAGGRSPRWTGDGRELFFIVEDLGIVVVPVDWASETGPIVGQPQPVVPKSIAQTRSFDVSNDGRRLLVNRKIVGGDRGSIRIVSGWLPVD